MNCFPILLVVLLGLIQSPGRAQTPRADNTLRLAFEADPNSLDPLQLWSNDAAAVSFLVFQSLLDQQPEGRLEPIVARELPTVSADHRVYTFQLRPGLRFSNGRELGTLCRAPAIRPALEFLMSLSRARQRPQELERISTRIHRTFLRCDPFVI